MLALPRLLRRLPWPELAGPLAITAVVTTLFHELLLGGFPVSHDHPAHMFNAWLTSDVLVPTGRLSGWTDLWFAGYPVNELYGPGGNLWVTLFRYLTFGQLSYGATYGLAIFGLLLLLPLSAYVLGRAFVGRIAGAVAGLLMSVTGGTWYDLGWFWILEMGVWPFALGAALTFVALVVLRRYLRRGGPRGLALAALGFALAVLGHPMSLLLLGLAGPLLVLHVLLEQGRAGATRALFRTLAAASLGVLLCAAWLVPFVAKSSYSQKLGETWMEAHEALPSLVQLSLYGPEWRLVMALAAVGFFFAIARRHVWAMYLASTGALMLLFASSTTLYELRLLDVMSPLASIQYPRFVGVVRVFVYVLAGYGLQELWRAAEPLRLRMRDASWRARARVALMALLPLVLVAPMAADLPLYIKEHHMPRKETIQTQRSLGWWDDYRAAAAWIAENVPHEPGSRVGAFGPHYDHVLSTLPMYTGLPVYTGGFVPAHTYRFFFDGQRDLDTLQAVGVRYVLALGGWGRGNDGAELRATFGPLRIYELRGEEPRWISASDCTVRGLVALDELMVADVSEVSEPCRIRIHRSDFPNWRATLDGEPLAIERLPATAGGAYSPFMSVEVPATGALMLEWRPTPSDRAGAVLSAFGVLLLALLGVATVRRRWWERLKIQLPVPPARVRRVLRAAVWAGLAFVVVAAFVIGVGRAREARYTFDRHLGEAEMWVESPSGRHECTPAETGRGWHCGEAWDEIRGGLFSFVYDSRYCVFAHPSPHGVKRLAFRNVPLGRRLSGFFGLLDSSQGTGAVTLTLRVGEAPPVTMSTDQVGRAVGFDLMTEPGSADVEVSIEAERPAWRHFCFNAQVVDQGPPNE